MGDIKLTKKKVVILGDSLTKGQLGVSYIYLLKAMVDEERFSLLTFSENGIGVRRLLEFLPRLKEEAPDTVVVFIGNNDASFELSQKNINEFNLVKFTENYKQLIQAIKDISNKIEIILVAPSMVSGQFDSPMNQLLERYSKIVHDLAKSKNLKFIDLISLQKNEIDLKKKSNQDLNFGDDRKIPPSKFLDPVKIVWFLKNILKLSDEKINSKFGSVFTIDGIHFNQRGADLVSSSIKKFITCVGFGLIFTAQLVHAKPFHRAVILAGGGFNMGISLGVLDALQEKKQLPDVVIGTCGGSLAAALMNQVEDPIQRKAILESKEFYGLLKKVVVHNRDKFWNPSNALQGLITLGSLQMPEVSREIPQLFDDYMFDVDQTLGLDVLKNPFSSTGVRSVIVATRLYFTKEEVGESVEGRYLYQEVFFTDELTKNNLIGYKSPLAIYSPEEIWKRTSTFENFTLGQAVRASISNPTMMEPAKIGDFSYISAALDLYPIELAHTLADEVIASFSSGFNRNIERPTLMKVFGFDPVKRVHEVHDYSADYWIDLTDAREILIDESFNPKINLANLKQLNTNIFELQIPDSFDEYLKKVRAQFKYGHDRAIEALNNKIKNEKKHIRSLHSDNASEQLLKQLGKD